MSDSKVSIYDKLKTVPPDALKEIQAGRLKGKSDINPQWRYERMTEVFGPCGIGWYYERTNLQFENGSENQIAVFVDVNLYVKEGEDWSKPIPGNGGSMFVTNEKNGAYTSDEAIKMATTDALSTSMKMLGMAADVYRGLMNDTKYSQPQQQSSGPSSDKQKITEWLSEEQFKTALQSDAKGITATINHFSKEGRGMKKDYRTQLTQKLATLKNQ